MSKTHPDVDYCVDDCSGAERSFKSFDEAAGFALAVAISGKENVHLDVVIWSEAGAFAYGGDDALETYREDPEASVHERFEIKANSQGRVA